MFSICTLHSKVRFQFQHYIYITFAEEEAPQTLSISCTRNFLERFCVEEYNMDSMKHNSFLSADLLPSLGASINQLTKLRKHIVSPVDPRFRCLLPLDTPLYIFRSVLLLLSSWMVAYCLIHQGMGDVASHSCDLFSLDLSFRVRLHHLQETCDFHCRQTLSMFSLSLCLNGKRY